MPLSIGLVGCGNWGRNILRDLRECGATVSVVVRSEATRQRALSLGAVGAHVSISELGTMDGFVVATPSDTHALVLEQLAPLGKPIFVEKPMTTDVRSARRLAEICAGRLFVMQKWRYHPGIERIREEAAAGALGEIRAVRIIRWGWGMPHDDSNPIWHLMPHDLAITLHWLGYVPPLRSVLLTSPLRFDAGLVARLGGGPNPLVTIDMSITSPVHRRCFAAIGSAASMELQDSYSPGIVVRRGPPGAKNAREELMLTAQDMPLLLEVRAFVEHLRGGPPPMTSAAEDLRIIERLTEIDTMAQQAAFPREAMADLG